MINTPEQLGSLCKSCVGACCMDSRLVLTMTEAQHMLDGGTNLQVVLGEYMLKDMFSGAVTDYRIDALEQMLHMCDNDEVLQEVVLGFVRTLLRLQENEEYYEIRGRCGYLDENNRCTAYESRPSICRDFPPGGKACCEFRERHGLETPEQTVILPIPTRRDT